MKQFGIILLSVLFLVTVGCNADGQAADKKVNLETENAKMSYAMGYNVGKFIKDNKDLMDMEVVMQAMRDAQKAEDKAQMTQEEMQKAQQAFQQKSRELMMAKRKTDGEKNLKEGEVFLTENAKKEGVKVTESGLQYTVMKEGTGVKPKATDRVKVHYKGTFLDGKEFDSSIKRNKPAEFPLNGVIPGWTEGLQLMNVGSKYKFFVPSKLGYGERGNRAIAPNAVLIFEVELLEILPPLPKAPPSKKMPKKMIPAAKPVKK